MAIELRHVRYLAAAAEAGQVSLAARRLHIAQPALSQAIRGLERELGTALLHRHARGVELTEAGEAFLARARTAIVAVDEAIEAARSRSECLSVGFVQFAAAELTGAIFNEFARRRPDVTVRLRELNFGTQTRALVTGRVGAAFLWSPHDDPDLAWEPLLSEPRVVGLPATHPLARKRSVTVDEIAGETFHGVHPSVPEAWADYWNLTKERGYRPAVTDDIPRTVPEIAALIAAGRAITSGPAGIARLYRDPAIAFVPIADAGPAVLALVWRKDNENPIVQALLGVARELRQRSPVGA